jgi:hypothetical protein
MLFVDHKTRLVYPSFQESKTASEACRSIYDYENFAKRYQVTVKSYHADNRAFHTETFQKAHTSRERLGDALTNCLLLMCRAPHDNYLPPLYHDWVAHP